MSVPKAGRWWWPVLAGALVGLALRLIFLGKPTEPLNVMMSAFVLFVPLAVGAVSVVVAERSARRSWTYYFGIGAAANALLVLGTLAILIEGIICAILAVPLFAVVGGLGGVVAGAICRWTAWPKRGAFALVVLPLVFGSLEQRLPLPQTIVSEERSTVIHATPERVWAALLAAQDIAPEEMSSGWMYRIGVPLPLAAVTRNEGGRLIRHIEMGRRVQFDQVATEWSAEEYILWKYRFTADSFPAGALDDHVRIGGRYFDVVDTEYRLEPVPQGTRLHVAMRYRVSTTFNWYARPIAAFLVGDFEETALAFYARRAQDS